MWKPLIKAKKPASIADEQSVPVFHLIETADELLKRYRHHFYELKQLISVTASDYQYFYLNLIKLVSVFMQQLPSIQYAAYHQPYGLLTLALDRVIAALKYRRAYMLPMGADTETCYKEQDAWTYALFTAALLKDISQINRCFDIALFDRQKQVVKSTSLMQPFTNVQASYYRFAPLAFEPGEPNTDNTALITALLPKASITWLKSHTALFKTWEMSLIVVGLPTENVLTDILTQVEAAITQTTIVNTKASSQQTNPEVMAEKIEIKTIPSTLIMSEAILQTEEAMPVSIPEVTLTERFIQWLKHAIAANALSLNQRESIVQHVAEGILIVMPAAYEQFQLYEGNVPTVISKRDKHRFLKALLGADYLIAPKSHQVLPRYYWGEWHNRQLIEGFLISPSILFPDNRLPVLNPHLHQEPDLNA